MPNLINWRLARNPLNYAIVTLMVVIAAIAFHVVAQGFTSPPAE